ncbi:restriction endonuclease subunit M [Mesoplasma melaleucae]|uniref:Type I restriction enzyme M protein n=1 Tax=Mesoplasma melaleucae TaxID=81459 RepID=A0A2K8NVF9_9MOLU|nr:N-6 DNA methylase [Mesoplasma melaleucae]ATZ17822.1 type I restriction enzyme M protein [Mesoplasma melaleucae]
MNIKLICPIRGPLNINEKSKDGLSFTEERQRIELVRFLLTKGYTKELFEFEYNIKFGSSKKYLRADLIIWENESKQNINIVCEVKRDSKHKIDAYDYQLEPAIKLTNSKYGIYFDNADNYLIYSNNKYSLNKLPTYGFEFNAKSISINDLRTITNIDYIYNKLDQLTHNNGISKEKRYEGIFQILLSKYYDEKYNESNLKFLINNNTFSEFKKLYDQSLKYYNINSQIKLKKEIVLPENIVIAIIAFLEEYSFIKSDMGIIQSFFMKFGAIFLKKDLAQYYTPIPIVKFISSLLKVTNSDRIIDPAGGSADFLVGILEKYKNSKIKNLIKENLHYWDISEDALKVAFINMVLHGDGRTNIEQLDSIEKWNYKNEQFDFVITNPPFGSKTKWEKDPKIMKHYELASEKENQQLGILFLERSINLLKANGILVIILPSGYLNNSSLKYIREFCINYRIVADISLPEGSFKGAETGVKTDILIIKKQKIKDDYRIFVSAPQKLGFDFKSKKLPSIYKRDIKTGKYILDEYNKEILDSDLENVISEFKKFAYDSNLTEFEQENINIKYNFLLKSELVNDPMLTLKPELYLNSYRNHMTEIGKNTVSLRELKDSGYCDIEIQKNETIKLVEGKMYSYIDISEAKKGDYSLDNKLHHWEIKNIGRASQAAETNDIFLSYLLGSKDKFFLMLEKNTDNIVVTNGMYRIIISDEIVRLSFYNFLFTNSFSLQFNALSTGHIQTNISLNKVWEFRFKLLEKDEISKVKEMIEIHKKYKQIYSTILD